MSSWIYSRKLAINDFAEINLSNYSNNYGEDTWRVHANGSVDVGQQATLFSISYPDNNIAFRADSICNIEIPYRALNPDEYLMGIDIVKEDTGEKTGYGLGWFRNTNNDGWSVWLYDTTTKTELPSGFIFNGGWGDRGPIDGTKFHVGIYRDPWGNMIWCKMINLYDWNNAGTVRGDIHTFAFSTGNLLSYYGALNNIDFDGCKLAEEIEVSSPKYGDVSTPEGYSGGTFDDSSDTISIPTAPTIGVSSTGFVNVYNPSPSALIGFGSELFPDLSFTPISSLPAPTDVPAALENIATVLTDFGNQIPNIIDMYINSNLIQYVLDCHIIPVAPSVDSAAAIKVGFRTFSQTAPKVASDYIDFDCGSLNVGEYYANYIDYAPFTSAKLFLPFVGFVDMLPEYWQSGTLSVTYRFNVIDGSFVAFVKSTSSKSKLSDTVIGQYGGNCCVHIPLTGANYSNMVSGLVSGAAAVLTSGSGAAAKVSAAVSSAVNVSQIRPNVQQSNGYNSTTSFLGVRTPYLLIERSVSSFSMNYATENGLPSNVTATLSSLSGYTEASDLILSGIDATDAELNEIAALLASGVIL